MSVQAAKWGLKLKIKRSTVKFVPEKFGRLLPKWFKLPGARRLAWLESDVLAHIHSGQTVTPQLKRRRGRSTKAEQIKRGDSQ